MNQEKINIIMFNMSRYSDWQAGIQNRNYHILHTLEKDNRIDKIIAVDFLPFNLKQGIKTYIKDILPNKNKHELIYADLTSKAYKKTNKIFSYSTTDIMYSQNKVIKEINKIKRILGINDAIIWSCNPLFIDIINKMNKSLFVFDTVDNWAEHSNYPKYRNRLLDNYKKIANNANVIFTVANSLVDFYKSLGRQQNTYYIPNGIDTDYYKKENLLNTKKIEHFETPNVKGKKIIGYIGTIQKDRMDIDLIANLAENHPDKIIALCGPIWKETQNEIEQKLSKFNNIIYTGRVKREEWIDYCMYFDVAINPHLLNAFIKYTCPTKIYEYLACGKPVVTTRATGTESFGHTIYTADTYDEFSNYITKALSENSELKKQERINTAQKEYSWDFHVQRMMDIIIDYTSTRPNPEHSEV